MLAAVVGDAIEGAAPEIRRHWDVPVARRIRIPHFDGAVTRAGQQSLVLAAHIRKTHALHNALVRLHGEQLPALSQVPDFHFAVSRTGRDHVKGARVLGQRVNAVDVAVAELGDEGRSKHALELSGIEGAGVFAGLFKGVEFGVEVAGLGDGGGAGGIIGLGGAGEGFDFLGKRSDRAQEQTDNRETYHGELFSRTLLGVYAEQVIAGV